MKSESKIVIKGYIFPAVAIAFGAIAAVTGNAAVATTAVALTWVIIVLMALMFVAMAANPDAVKKDTTKTPRTLLRYALSVVFALSLFSVLAAIDAVVTASAFAVTYVMLTLLRVMLDRH